MEYTYTMYMQQLHVIRFLTHLNMDYVKFRGDLYCVKSLSSEHVENAPIVFSVSFLNYSICSDELLWPEKGLCCNTYLICWVFAQFKTCNPQYASAL